MLIKRRSFIVGLAALVASPAIVRASSIMPVRNMILTPETTVHVQQLFGGAWKVVHVCVGNPPWEIPLPDGLDFVPPTKLTFAQWPSSGVNLGDVLTFR